MPERSARDTMVEAHRLAGLLEAPELGVARSLLRIADESRPEIMLAAAWAVRGPRHGHVCVDLARPRFIDTQRQEIASGRELPWPELEPWLDALESSPLVRVAGSESTATPLVLDGTRLYTDRYYRYEQRLAGALAGRATARRKLDPTRLASALDSAFGPVASDELDRQRLAAAAAAMRSLCIIVGGPGTGKTTTVRRLLQSAFALARADARRLPRVALAAPTGKAASRLRASLLEGADDDLDLQGLQAQTLHRLLRRHPDNATRFRYGRELALPHDIVIVDEASMIDLALMTKLVEAVARDATLILLGDPDQLASVEAGAVLGDLAGARDGKLGLSPDFASELLVPMGGDRAAPELKQQAQDGSPSTSLLADCVHQLTRVHRFRAEGGVGRLATLLQSAEQGTKLADEALAFLAQGSAGDWHFDPSQESLHWAQSGQIDSERLRRLVLAGYGPAVRAALDAPLREAGDDAQEAARREAEHAAAVLGHFESLRVLCAHRAGARGVRGVDQLITRWLTQLHPDFLVREGAYPGLPVLVTQNDPRVGLYNGDIGVCLPHPLDPAKVRVAFWSETGDVRFVSPTRLPAYRSVFAMSIHKSQGSQFDHAVVVLPEEPSPICTRELVYTAITRAKKGVTLVGSESVLRSSLSRRVERLGGLADALAARKPG